MSASLVAVALFFTACPTLASTLHFKTEVYAPYSYRVGKAYRGASIEQLQQLMKDIPVDYTVEIMPWARAYALARHEPMNCLLTTAHTQERHELFKWVEPLMTDRIILVSRSGAGVIAASIPDARQYVVGTQRHDYTQTLLKQLEFQRIDVATAFDATLKKLLAGRIALMPVAARTYRKLKSEGVEIEPQATIAVQQFSIACNRDVPDALIEQMQAALDRLIADGRQMEIFRKYGLEPAE
ncbi:transporter substrate-binding domain-containing protein [Rhizobiaceae bacterium n13]|uniref:Transporter substrate-binding domain-containing protein n=1 Tax=Ferirhizobium litorale TaxID=2927786 RepID=A0AAE3U0X6_9HYPH|nr:ABC transporter substrate-binding protein [Fererhizobium litorale]MDI7860879.1 transporter substrate-binding domain-containing protein [Fererhizobium litorale]MDI7921027.1 transporter substrate-binding domain-containing protein [Fererhizobium litorale]